MPEVGRFISQDPIAGVITNPMTMNGYNYVSNNPFKYIDPSGMTQEYLDSGAGGGSWKGFYLSNQNAQKEIDFQNLSFDILSGTWSIEKNIPGFKAATRIEVALSAKVMVKASNNTQVTQDGNTLKLENPDGSSIDVTIGRKLSGKVNGQVYYNQSISNTVEILNLEIERKDVLIFPGQSEYNGYIKFFQSEFVVKQIDFGKVLGLDNIDIEVHYQITQTGYGRKDTLTTGASLILAGVGGTVSGRAADYLKKLNEAIKKIPALGN
jgi:hypothetical protein